jgi:hypothetical protein
MFERKKEAEQFLISTVHSVHDSSYTDLHPALMSTVFDQWEQERLNVHEQLGEPKVLPRDRGAALPPRIRAIPLRPALNECGLGIEEGTGAEGRRRLDAPSDQRYLRYDSMEHVERLLKQQTGRAVLKPNEL